MVKRQDSKSTKVAAVIVYGGLTVLLTMGLGPVGIVCGVLAYLYYVGSNKATK